MDQNILGRRIQANSTALVAVFIKKSYLLHHFRGGKSFVASFEMMISALWGHTSEEGFQISVAAPRRILIFFGGLQVIATFNRQDNFWRFRACFFVQWRPRLNP